MTTKPTTKPNAPGYAIVSEKERTRLLARVVARSEAEGDCLLWQGGMSGRGQPIISFRSCCRYVRGLMYEVHHGKAVPPGMLLAARCRDARCISPTCARPISLPDLRRMDARRGAYSRPAANAARVLGARKRARIHEDVVQQVRDFVGSAAQAAKATGVSLSHCKAIRAGRARVPLCNPWRGLL